MAKHLVLIGFSCTGKTSLGGLVFGADISDSDQEIPIRGGWRRLRAVSDVVLFRRSAQGTYDSLKGRRDAVFQQCPEAKLHDNWDLGVMVDEQRTEYARQAAVDKISRLLDEREQHYRDHDAKVNTDDQEDALLT